jgi:hypothetical protein
METIERDEVFGAALTLLAAGLDAKNVRDRLASWKAEKEGAERKIAELAHKEAAIEKRIAEQAAAFVKERSKLDEEWASFKEWKFSQEARIASEASKVPALEATIASATATILNESGLRPHALQGGPDLLSLLRELFSGKDVHFGEDKSGRDPDVSFEAEPLEHATAVATVRRSKSLRRTHADA